MSSHKKRANKSNIGLGSGCEVMSLCLSMNTHDYLVTHDDLFKLVEMRSKSHWQNNNLSFHLGHGDQFCIAHPFNAVAFDIDAPRLRSLAPEFCNVPIGGVDTFLGKPAVSMRSFPRKVAKRHTYYLHNYYIINYYYYDYYYYYH